MKLVGNLNHDCAYFKYEHNTSYQQIQKRFLEAVESLNPDNIVVSSHSENMSICYIGFEVLNTMAVKSSVFWNVTLCTLVKAN
jgi:SAM-dependent MidA family methyltransferase